MTHQPEGRAQGDEAVAEPGAGALVVAAHRQDDRHARRALPLRQCPQVHLEARHRYAGFVIHRSKHAGVAVCYAKRFPAALSADYVAFTLIDCAAKPRTCTQLSCARRLQRMRIMTKGGTALCMHAAGQVWLGIRQLVGRATRAAPRRRALRGDPGDPCLLTLLRLSATCSRRCVSEALPHAAFEHATTWRR